MKRKLSLIMLLASLVLVANKAWAEQCDAPEVMLESNIEKVTVFRKGAQVERKAKVNLPVGATVLVFDHIPPTAYENSIQVGGKGDFTILSVSMEKNYLSSQEKKRKEASKTKREKEINTAEDRLTELKMQLEENALMLSVYQEEEEVMKVNRSLKGENVGVKVTEIEAAANLYRQRLEEIRKKCLELTREANKLNKEQELLNKQLVEWRGETPIKARNVVMVKVAANQAQNANLELSYVVQPAQWIPKYDMRVNDIEAPAELTFKAEVAQQSGEDWKDVDLILSTGNPFLSGEKPELVPYELAYSYSPPPSRRDQSGGGGSSQIIVRGSIDVNVRRIRGKAISNYDGEPLIGANIVVRSNATGEITGATTDFDGNYEVDIPAGGATLTCNYIGYSEVSGPANSAVIDFELGENFEMLDEVVVTSARMGFGRRSGKTTKSKKTQAAPQAPVVQYVEKVTTAQYEIQIPYSIKGNGQEMLVEVQKLDIPAEYQYYCVPKLDTDAFLVAHLTDWEKYKLMTGKMNLFFEGKFMGESILNMEETEDTLEISLGRDKDIIVKREQSKEFTSKKMLGTQRKTVRAWDIELRNTKDKPIRLIVQDQIPITKNSEIDVSHGDLSGGKLEEDTGFVEWDLQLSPKETKKLLLKYQVKFPKRKPLYVE